MKLRLMFYRVASGDYGTAAALQKVYSHLKVAHQSLIHCQAGGALLFIVAALGWYMCFFIMATEMRLPVIKYMPVYVLPKTFANYANAFRPCRGDLSHFWPDANVPLSDEEKQK